MKMFWYRLRVSIAGARLSHLAQKDRIWDHGSMTELVRIIFSLVLRTRSGGDMDLLKKQCSVSCFKKLSCELDEINRTIPTPAETPVIKEIAIIDVQPGKNNKPDMFTALIKGVSKDTTKHNDYGSEFLATYSFARQGDWWLLDKIKAPHSIY